MISYGQQLPVNQIYVTLLFRNVGKNSNKSIERHTRKDLGTTGPVASAVKIDPVELSVGNSRKENHIWI